MQRWVTFDCYGTLIDWNAGIAAELARIWPTRDTHALVSDFHTLEPLIERDGTLTYRQVLRRALLAIAAVRDLAIPEGEETALAESVPRWPPFPEVASAMSALRDAGLRLAILSNTDLDYVQASIARIGVEIDEVVVASAIGSYKPGHRHWHEFHRISGAGPDDHVHVAASLFHDIGPCAELSIPSVWINRLGERSPLPRAAELPDLTGVAAAVDRLC
ncbi:MAG: HAD family hydrolase [Actinomycetota bacterium]|nr:HAD family hydrolase [Actinomycetota bacterium]